MRNYACDQDAPSQNCRDEGNWHRPRLRDFIGWRKQVCTAIGYTILMGQRWIFAASSVCAQVAGVLIESESELGDPASDAEGVCRFTTLVQRGATHNLSRFAIALLVIWGVEVVRLFRSVIDRKWLAARFGRELYGQENQHRRPENKTHDDASWH